MTEFSILKLTDFGLYAYGSIRRGCLRMNYAWTPFEAKVKGKPIQIFSGVASLCDAEVAGSIPGRVIPKTLKMVLAALSLGGQH